MSKLADPSKKQPVSWGNRPYHSRFTRGESNTASPSPPIYDEVEQPSKNFPKNWPYSHRPAKLWHPGLQREWFCAPPSDEVPTTTVEIAQFQKLSPAGKEEKQKPSSIDHKKQWERNEAKARHHQATDSTRYPVQILAFVIYPIALIIEILIYIYNRLLSKHPNQILKSRFLANPQQRFSSIFFKPDDMIFKTGDDNNNNPKPENHDPKPIPPILATHGRSESNRLSSGCANCKKRGECWYCTACSTCQTCRFCKSCTDCRGCEWCQDCIDCEDCVNCVGCVGLRGARGIIGGGRKG